MPVWSALRKKMIRMLLQRVGVLSVPAATRVLDRLGRLEYAALPGVRWRFDRAVTRANETLGTRWDLADVAPALSSGLLRWRARDILLDGRSDAEVASRFDVRGREHLDAAVAAGKGVILLANHFGAHMMPAHWLYREHYSLRLYMERPRSVSRYLASHFDSDGPLSQSKIFISRKSDPAESARSILRATKVLRAGMVLKIACDVRWAGTHAARGRFLGQSYDFSATWVILAAMTGAAVVPVYCRSDRFGRFDLEFAPAYHVPSEAARDGRTAEWVQRSLEAISERVAAEPASSNDYFFWADEPQTSSSPAA